LDELPCCERTLEADVSGGSRSDVDHALLRELAHLTDCYLKTLCLCVTADDICYAAFTQFQRRVEDSTGELFMMFK